MRTFIQLRDGIGFAVLNTTGEPDHSVTPDHTTAIEVFTDNPDQFLRKAYNAGTWFDAPIIRFAEYNENGELIEIKRTVFAHEIPNNAAVMPDEANGLWKFINGEWVAPVYVEHIVVEPPQTMIESPQITEEQNVEETSVEEATN